MDIIDCGTMAPQRGRFTGAWAHSLTRKVYLFADGDSARVVAYLADPWWVQTPVAEARFYDLDEAATFAAREICR